MIPRDLSRLLPPGWNEQREKVIFVTSLLVSALFFLLSFVIGLANALENIWYPGFASIEIEVDSCSELLEYSPMGFRCTWLLALVTALAHYTEYRSGSKSNYTMRRLGRPLELHIRCWAVPLLVFGVCLVTEALLRILCGGIYLLAIPVDIDAANLWREIWS